MEIGEELNKRNIKRDFSIHILKHLLTRVTPRDECDIQYSNLKTSVL